MLSQRIHPVPQSPLGGSPARGDLTPSRTQHPIRGDKELNTVSKKALETWFPARAALISQRGGSGRQTSARMLNLQLRCEGAICELREGKRMSKNQGGYCFQDPPACSSMCRVSSELPASPAQPSPLPNASMATPGTACTPLSL